MSSASLRAVAASVGEDGAPEGEVRDLIEALETFAFQSERVLAKLDLRAAAQARHVARQLCTVAPFVRLGLDEELRESASLELAELMAQARVCLGRPPLNHLGRSMPQKVAQNDTRFAPPEDEPASSVRSRRDQRRDPTQDAELTQEPASRPLVAPASRPSSPFGDLEGQRRVVTEGEAVDQSALRSRTTQPEGVDAEAQSAPLESGIRRARRPVTPQSDDDAAAARQWKSMLGNASTAVRAIDVARSVVTLTAGRRKDQR